MKNLLTALVALNTFTLTAQAEAPSPTLKQNAVGVVYLKNETAQSYKLQVVFPEEQIASIKSLYSGDKVKIPPKLMVFDQDGLIGEITPKEVVGVRDFCVNDGGVHYWPVLSIDVPKETFLRPLVRFAKADDIAAFVSADPRNLNSLVTDDAKETEKGISQYHGAEPYFFRTLKIGRIDSKPVASIIERSSESGCGDKLEQNHLNLKTNDFEETLRCCGP